MAVDNDGILREVNDAVNDHMQDQPHSVTCAECGADLNVKKMDVDIDNDLSIEVEPCDCVIPEEDD